MLRSYEPVMLAAMPMMKRGSGHVCPLTTGGLLLRRTVMNTIPGRANEHRRSRATKVVRMLAIMSLGGGMMVFNRGVAPARQATPSDRDRIRSATADPRDRKNRARRGDAV